MIPIFRGILTFDYFRLFKMGLFSKWHAFLGGEGQEVQIKITKPEIVTEPFGPMSHRQRKYYYGVIAKIFAQEYGCTKKEADEELKKRFGIKRKRDLTTVLAEQFFAKCRMLMASEMNVYVPLPNEICSDSVKEYEE